MWKNFILKWAGFLLHILRGGGHGFVTLNYHRGGGGESKMGKICVRYFINGPIALFWFFILMIENQLNYKKN